MTNNTNHTEIVRFLTATKHGHDSLLHTVHAGGERGYKLVKHQRWVKALNGGTFAELVERDPEEAIALIKRTNSGLNLLHSTENAAFSKAFEDKERALKVAKTLAVVLEKGFDTDALEAYFSAINNLESDVFKKGMTKPRSWPIASQLLFLADPTRFPFVKPKKLQTTLRYLGIKTLDGVYKPKLSAHVYQAVAKSYHQVHEFLLDHFTDDELKVHDLIDIQTIIFMIAGGYGKHPKLKV